MSRQAPNRLDVTGWTHGRLTVLEECDPHVRAICTCGNEVKIRRGNFLAGRVKSCGCIRIELLIKRNEQRKAIILNPFNLGIQPHE